MNGYSHLTDEEIMNILNDLSNNLKYKDISEKYNISIAACRALAKRYGIIDAKRKERLKQNEKIIELYNEGYSYTEIGRIVGRDHSDVIHILDRYGIPRYHKRKRNVDVIKRNEEIVRLYQTSNYTHVELGKMFNLSYDYITQIINNTLHISNDKMLDIRDDKINDMVNEGKTNKEIAQIMNMTRKTIEAKIINDNYHKRLNERNEEIFNLYQSGNYTRQELADMFNLTAQTISNIIRKYKNNNNIK